MPLYAYRGTAPRVAASAFIAPTAVLIGDVTVEEEASIWFGAVLRGDLAPVVIGARSNIQDNCVVHVEVDGPTLIGADVTVGHLALVHSSVVENNVLVGMGAVLVGGSTVGSGTIIGGGAVVPQGMHVPPRSLVVGVPAKVVREARPEDERWTVRGSRNYVALAEWYRDNLDEVR